jgi:hypothetical protein
MTFEFRWSEEKHTPDFFSMMFCLVSLNLLSSVLDRVFKTMDELFKKVIFIHLLCAWMAAFLRLMFTISINTLSSESILMTVLAVLKYVEVTFRNLGMASNLVMTAMYGYALHEASEGRTGYISRAPISLFVVYLFYGLYSIFHLGITARLEVDRTYMLWTNTSRYSEANRYIQLTLMVFWLLIQLMAVLFSFMARFKYGNVLHHSPKLYKMYMSFFQLMISFAIFNLPSAIATVVSDISPFDNFSVTESLLGWKTLQGAVDSLIIYNLFFKQKDNMSM